MMEIMTNIAHFFALLTVSSLCIGVTAFVWFVMYSEWQDRR